MTRTLLIAALLLCAPLTAVSCGPESEPAPDAAAEARQAESANGQAATEPDAAPVEVGPVVAEPAIEEADLRVRPEPLVTREEAEAAEQARAAPPSPNRIQPTPATNSDALWRTDGRPTWWLDRAGWRDGRYTICAEAFGEDVRAARRAAIDAARRNAESTLGGTIRDERVETALVRAVPGAPSERRYVGYVRLSALRGD
ncbi:MAG: hypothetical protein ACTS27_02430 [Phycisphaerales bacterium]